MKMCMKKYENPSIFIKKSVAPFYVDMVYNILPENLKLLAVNSTECYLIQNSIVKLCRSVTIL